MLKNKSGHGIVAAIFLGPVGCGKGTQGKMLGEIYRSHHISIGELLRQKIEVDANFALEHGPTVAAGKLVPDPVAISLANEKAIQCQNEGAGGIFLYDGLPRNGSQAKMIHQVIEHPGSVIAYNFVKLRKEVAVKRALRGRPDDGEAASRFDDWKIDGRDAVDALRDHGVYVVDIDARLNVGQIHGQIKNELVGHLKGPTFVKRAFQHNQPRRPRSLAHG